MGSEMCIRDRLGVFGALGDLEYCERDPRYRINMGLWLAPTGSFLPMQANCQVCLAGSVMARTFNCNEILPAGPSDYSLEADNRFRALDATRENNLLSAFYFMRYDRESVLVKEHHPNIPSYNLDPEGFKSALRDLAEILEAAGY